eukprot:TRINITY_DN12136_c0_g1_i1.p1 TRINITY_DN12136_c0_g1~~TRINITY_DN12136_c0_g1_i1.p1  ORF type:complete len:350 (-),score=61.61 TRINITY_DN12136_c0_g1_i1:69-1118(-)
MASNTVIESLLQTQYVQNRVRVKSEIDRTTSVYPTLQAKEDTFVSNDGQSHLLISLSGTIPVSINNVVYQIPIQIMILRDFPFSPPVAFVRPTKDMIIDGSHPSVDSSGQCHLNYLNKWNVTQSNITELTKELQISFSQKSPVYKKKPQPQPQHHPLSHPPLHTSNSLPNFRTNSPYAAPTHVQPPSPTQTNPIEKLNAVLREKCVQTLGNTTNDIAQFQLVQQRLIEGSALIGQSINQFKADKKELEDYMIVLMQKDEEITRWLDKNLNVTVNVDDMYVPGDNLSNQMFDLVAQDATIEDTVYELDKALYGGCIDVEMYLKSVRMLSREQFHVRALAEKVYSLQSARK